MANQTAPARAAESTENVYIVSMSRPLAVGVPIRFYRESPRSAPSKRVVVYDTCVSDRRLARGRRTTVAFFHGGPLRFSGR